MNPSTLTTRLTAPLKQASSLLVLREVLATSSNPDFEILMIKRSAGNSFKNYHAFPGGLINRSDSIDKWRDSFVQSNLHPIIENEKNFSAKLCALRETFEECGLLLMTGLEKNYAGVVTKPVLINTSKNKHPELWQLRHNIHDEKNTFSEVYSKNKDKKDVISLPPIDCLRYCFHFVTPIQESKRWSTYFFVMVLPHSKENDQILQESLSHDDCEVQSLSFQTPDKFLELFDKQEISLLPPQWYMLHKLSKLGKLRNVQEWLRNREKLVEEWCPKFLETDNIIDLIVGDPPVEFKKDSEFWILLPGDREYTDAASGEAKTTGLHRFKARISSKGRFNKFSDLVECDQTLLNKL